MRALLFSAALVLSSSTLAHGYEGYIRLQVCLDQHAPCPGGRPDLVVTEHRLEAPHGLRAESASAETARIAAVRFDAAFLVKNHRGREYRVWVRRQPSPLLRVDVEVAQERGRELTGRFATAGVHVGTLESAGSFGVLTLSEGGRYSLQSGSGHYWVRDGLVLFDGAIAHWGPATVSPDESSLTFRFERGGMTWSIRFAQGAATEPRAPVAAR